jgi:hypothetical protein
MSLKGFVRKSSLEGILVAGSSQLWPERWAARQVSAEGN